MFSSNTTQTSGGYEISRSLRFNSADSANLSRTPASNGNQSTWTLSFWIKRSAIGLANTGVFYQQTASSDTGFFSILFPTADTLVLEGWTSTWRVTNQLFRDPSAWYHIVVSVDTTQATANNRIRLYVNGAEVTSFSTIANPTQNSTTGVNGTGAAGLGRNNSLYFNGYMTEVYMVDGQQLTPSSFGETNVQTGVWGPKAYSGSYGTNGFYVNFSDNSNTTAATLGKDYSGNGNNWTPNNFSVSAGAGNDSLVDVPTNWGVDTGVGGTVRGNYATWNSILQTNDATNTYANGNLEVSATSSNWANGTISTNSGSYYFELTPSVGASGLYLGINNTKTDVRVTAYSGGIEASPGGGSNQTGLASWSNGDIIGVAVNGVSKTVQFYRNGSTYGSQVTYTTALDLFPFARNALVSSSTTIINAGQRPFAYTAPSGFKALNTQNLPTPTIGATTATQAGKFFNPVLYTGTGSSLSVTGVGFQPDWTWIKERNAAADHGIYDVVRGVQKQLESNNTGAETTETTGLTAFGSDGFTVGALAQLNTSADTYVAWNWKANGAGVTNTAGSITSTVSANTTSGFSVVTYTGTGANATVGHGLGAAPKMVITKKRGSTSDWAVWHTSIANTEYLLLNTTAAKATGATYWNSTTPTSTLFSVGTADPTNVSSATYVAYVFAEVPGYSKFGSYTGNGLADGPFVFCGFRPAYVMIKRTDTTGNWIVWDTTRNTFNVMGEELYPNLSNAGSTATDLDVLSNGFKLRNTTADFNASGGTYIFMALASSPFKYSLAR